MGDIIAGSGFEDVVFQSGVSSSDSLRAVLSGTHYNRAWNVHSGTFYIWQYNFCILHYLCE